MRLAKLSPRRDPPPQFKVQPTTEEVVSANRRPHLPTMSMYWGLLNMAGGRTRLPNMHLASP